MAKRKPTEEELAMQRKAEEAMLGPPVREQGPPEQVEEPDGELPVAEQVESQTAFEEWKAAEEASTEELSAFERWRFERPRHSEPDVDSPAPEIFPAEDADAPRRTAMDFRLHRQKSDDPAPALPADEPQAPILPLEAPDRDAPGKLPDVLGDDGRLPADADLGAASEPSEASISPVPEAETMQPGPQPRAIEDASQGRQESLPTDDVSDARRRELPEQRVVPGTSQELPDMNAPYAVENPVSGTGGGGTAGGNQEPGMTREQADKILQTLERISEAAEASQAAQENTIEAINGLAESLENIGTLS